MPSICQARRILRQGRCPVVLHRQFESVPVNVRVFGQFVRDDDPNAVTLIDFDRGSRHAPVVAVHVHLHAGTKLLFDCHRHEVEFLRAVHHLPRQLVEVGGNERSRSVRGTAKSRDEFAKVVIRIGVVATVRFETRKPLVVLPHGSRRGNGGLRFGLSLRGLRLGPGLVPLRLRVTRQERDAGSGGRRLGKEFASADRVCRAPLLGIPVGPVHFVAPQEQVVLARFRHGVDVSRRDRTLRGSQAVMQQESIDQHLASSHLFFVIDLIDSHRRVISLGL